jgi:hypothetical protein
MRMKIIIIILLFLFVTVSLSQPKWITETPLGYLNDYFVASGISNKSESEARQIAFAHALQKIIQSGTITIQSTQNISSESLEQFKNGQSISLDVANKIADEIRISGEAQTIRGLKEEEMFTQNENGLYTVWLLTKIPKRYPKPYSKPSQISPVWRSVIAPGWGQFYKGQNTKGYIISISEVLLVPAGFILQSLKNTAEVDAQNSRTQALRDYYVDQANIYHNISVGCFIAAGAMYVFNILDATISQGEKVYVEVLPDSHSKPVFVEHFQTTIQLNVRF